jgi:hypothetical protein
MPTVTPGTYHHSKFVRQHPEYRPVFNWSGWPNDGHAFHERRLRMAQIVHVLKRDGDIYSINASGDLKQRAADYGVDVSGGMGTWRNLVADMEALGWLKAVINGRRTMSITLNPDAQLPPDPFECRPPVRKSQPRVTTAAGLMAILNENDAARAEDGLGNGGPDPDYQPSPEVEPPEVGAAPEPNAEPDPTAPSHEPTPAPEPTDYEMVDPTPVPVISGAFLGDQSIPLVDQCALLMRLSGNLMVAVSAMEAGLAEPPADADMATRMGALMEEVQTLRRRLARANEDTAKSESARRQDKAALNAMQQQNVILSENLRKALNGDARPDESGRKALEKMMKERPRIAS